MVALLKDLLKIHACKLALVASSLASIPYLYDSKASPSLLALRSARHSFLFAVCHNDSSSHPNSCKNAYLNIEGMISCLISTYHGKSLACERRGYFSQESASLDSGSEVVNSFIVMRTLEGNGS